MRFITTETVSGFGSGGCFFFFKLQLKLKKNLAFLYLVKNFPCQRMLLTFRRCLCIICMIKLIVYSHTIAVLTESMCDFITLANSEIREVLDK